MSPGTEINHLSGQNDMQDMQESHSCYHTVLSSRMKMFFNCIMKNVGQETNFGIFCHHETLWSFLENIFNSMQVLYPGIYAYLTGLKKSVLHFHIVFYYF